MSVSIRLAGLVVLLLVTAALDAAEKLPTVRDPRLVIELFAADPAIVTPTGLDVDHAGRVFALESNTHFPPEGYNRHASDRLLVLRDRDGDGRSERPIVFADGFVHAMSVAVRTSFVAGQPDTVLVATRKEVVALWDDDGDLVADRRRRVLQLDTPGNYPHNGLAGFAFDGRGQMYIGLGENLGAAYKLIGSDKTTLPGGGEGGNIYRCRPDGSKLELFATGFWNPHASCVDAFGRLFNVDNDPDSLPPCRLMHIVAGGDYGYRFRNGRTGFHPFTSWNGEIP
ncbi:MAG: PVC-type heme-binding CxxCH protein, partial [Planctomycetaceae bacterium]